MGRPDRTPPPARDLAARFLEAGLCVTVVVAPLPFGSVGPGGRAVVEGLAVAMGLMWLARSVLRYTPLPNRTMTIGVLGLLTLASLQLLPLGDAIVGALSPNALELRARSVLDENGDAGIRAEQSILGIDPTTLEPPASLSLDPSATASALRNGVAMVALFLVAACVAMTRGVRQLAIWLLISGSFQGLYGLLILASGHDMIWNRPKVHYLNAATGTFVNKNHFAVFVGMSLACGLALILDDARRNPLEGTGRRKWVELLGGAGSRRLAWGLLLVLGLAGVMLSLSRAGIVLTLLALAVTWLVTASRRVLRTRAIVAAIVLAVALTPMLQLGADRLVERYSQTAFDLTKSNSRSMVWRDTLDMVTAFPLTGSGFGTFATAYPAFRSPQVRLFYAHAHNDPLQVIAEAGVPGALLMLLALIPLAGLCMHCLRGAKGVYGVGFAAALLVVMLHTLIDFDFRIPANAMVAAILSGALFGLPWKDPR